MDISGPRITPSRPDYWKGTPDQNGLTVEQNETLARMSGWRARTTAFGLPDLHIHRLSVEPRNQNARLYDRYVICPVLGSTRDGDRLKIVAPNGMEEWVPAK